MDRQFQSRTLVVLMGFVCVLSLLSVRLIYLQQICHDEFTQLAEESHVHRVPLEAQRGWIVDRYGKPLACNETRYTMFADKYHLADLNVCLGGVSRAKGIPARDLRRAYSAEQLREIYLDHVSATLAPPLGYSADQLAVLLRDKERSEIILAKGYREEEVDVLKAQLAEAGVKGIYARRTVKRFYPQPDRLTHVIGFTDHEGIGREGIEGVMEEVLSGQDGHRYIERDRRGREIAAYRGEVVSPVDGNNVRLTVDSKLQGIVESVLDETGDDPEGIYAPTLGAEKISVVLMHPLTGEVLAMANRPHFDLESREGNRRNFAVADTYEPGSTIKIVTFGGIFDRGLVRPTMPVFCHNGRLFEDGMLLEDHHPYEYLSVNEVFKKSSNIGTYKLAKQLGKQGFFDYLQAFGFGSRTGIGLSGETHGLVHRVENWSRPSFSRMAMGYEVSVTPLQMLTALGAVANGGELMEPRIVAAIEDPEGNVLERSKRNVVRRVMSAEAAAKVRDAMVTVTEKGGTGTKAAVAGYKLAGKTGTAQKYDEEEKRYLKGRYVVSFMGFLPADRPELMGIVVVDDPKVDHVKRYGGTIAAPLFQRIAERAMEVLSVEPDYDTRIGAIGGGAR